MNPENDPRVQAAQLALAQALPSGDVPRAWHKNADDAVATVLVMDVVRDTYSRHSEEMVGVAIHDSRGLFLAVRHGSKWEVSQPRSGGSE